jgi:mRNA (guanine-N7-)-methyltransferase
MPAFDPVRDAVLNSPIAQTPKTTLSPSLASPSLGRRATDLSVLLNSHSQEPSLHTPPLRSSTLSHLLHGNHDNTFNEKLDASQPLTRSTIDSQSTFRSTKSMFTSSPSPTRESPVSRSRPSSSSSSVSVPYLSQPNTRPLTNTSMLPPPPSQLQSTIPYNPKVRMTPPNSVMIPMTPAEVEMYKDYRYRGRGVALITLGTKRKRSEELPEFDINQPPMKKLAGDVGVVVDHCQYSLLSQIHGTNLVQITHVRMWGWCSVLNRP